MADSVSPTTFRLSAEDRNLLEAVAHASGMTLSAFVREAAMAAARGYLASEGIEKVLEADRAYLRERDTTARRLTEHREALERHASSQRQD